MPLFVRPMIVLAWIGLAWLVSGKLRSPSESQPAAGKQRLWLVALVGLLVSLAASLAVKVTGDQSNLTWARSTITRPLEEGMDSWYFIDSAVAITKEAPSQPLYSEMFFRRHQKFQYPTTSLIAWDAFRTASGWNKSTLFLYANLFCFPLLGLCGLLSSLIFRESCIRIFGREPAESRLEKFVLLAVGTLIPLFFFPLSVSWYLGQVQTILSVLAIGSIYCWQKDRKALAGLLIGLCCLYKPQWAVTLLWGVLRRERTFAAAAIATIAVGGVAAGWLYGFGQYLDYLPALSYMSHHGESFHLNQSLNGVLQRVLRNGSAVSFDDHSFPAYHPVIYWATLLFGMTLAIFTIGRGWRRSARAEDFAVILFLGTFISPIAWSHHYGFMLGAFAVWIPQLLANPGRRKGKLAAITVLWIVVSQYPPFLFRFPNQGLAALLLSPLFFGSTALFAWVLVRNERSARTARPFGNVPAANP